jgi:PST family polysaccharide transporter
MTTSPGTPLAAEPTTRAAPASAAAKSTYGEILRSTTLIGASTLVNLAVGVLRTKAMAVLLGPAGFGLMGIFTSIADMARSVAEMGINSSGVRQIALAVGCGDAQRIAHTVLVLRRVAIFLGIFGATLLAAFARPISTLTYVDDRHAGAVALLSVVVFLRLVSDGQGALLQGMRRIGDMARIGVLGSMIGTLVSIPIVYWLREDGVVPALIAVAAVTSAVSWRYARRVHLDAPTQTLSTAQLGREVASLLRLGLAFMVSGFLTLGASYAVRAILVRSDGLAAAGLYQAAWTLGGLYVGFVLQAMGADFYPRLVAAAQDNALCNRLINEQAHVSLLLAGTGVTATLTLAPWVISLMYSAEFQGATELLRWICLAMAMRVITWPIGYILIAKGRTMLFVVVDLTWTIVNIGLTWVCVQHFGLVGAGIAFFGSYVFHLLLVYPIGARLTGFRWSPTNRRAGLLFIGGIALVQAGFELLDSATATAVGTIVTLLASVWSLHVLRSLVTTQELPGRLAWLLRSPMQREKA